MEVLVRAGIGDILWMLGEVVVVGRGWGDWGRGWGDWGPVGLRLLTREVVSVLVPLTISLVKETVNENLVRGPVLRSESDLHLYMMVLVCGVLL